MKIKVSKLKTGKFNISLIDLSQNEADLMGSLFNFTGVSDAMKALGLKDFDFEPFEGKGIDIHKTIDIWTAIQETPFVKYKLTQLKGIIE